MGRIYDDPVVIQGKEWEGKKVPMDDLIDTFDSGWMEFIVQDFPRLMIGRRTRSITFKANGKDQVFAVQEYYHDK